MASEVQRESGAVINYEIYSGFDDDANLTDFVERVAEDKRDQDPNAVFLFVYGNYENMTFSNFGNASASVNDQSIPGGGSPFRSFICVGDSRKPVDQDLDTASGAWKTSMSVDEDSDIEIEIQSQNYTFQASRHRQVIFIVQKEEGEESFVSVG